MLSCQCTIWDRIEMYCIHHVIKFCQFEPGQSEYSSFLHHLNWLAVRLRNWNVVDSGVLTPITLTWLFFQCGTIVSLIEGHSHLKATLLIISLISGVLDSKILQNCATSRFNSYQAILFYYIRDSLISGQLLYIKTDSMVYIRLGYSP